MIKAVPRARSGETHDAFYHGRIRISQKKRGYRFAVDAPLLADFIRTRKTDDILDVGTGSGVISLLLSLKPFRRITALEIQKGLAGLAERNVKANGLGKRIKVVRGDFRRYRPRRRFDLVFSNPPYIRQAAGFLSGVSEKAIAKHELHGALGDLLRKTAEWLKKDGRACFVFPERRRQEFVEAAAANGLRVRRLRLVLPRAGEPANLFLAELAGGGRAKKAADGRGAAVSGGAAGAAKRGAAATIMLPLVLFGPDGKYTAEAEAIFAGP
ncbi:MAG: methyltransferase [Acidobacteriota bacterium]